MAGEVTHADGGQRGLPLAEEAVALGAEFDDRGQMSLLEIEQAAPEHQTGRLTRPRGEITRIDEQGAETLTAQGVIDEGAIDPGAQDEHVEFRVSGEGLQVLVATVQAAVVS